tara:strand:- start:71 stop:355 length:285 start_codon:yes stop_codon:yes gene_type:complete
MQYIVSGSNEDNGEFMTEPYLSKEAAIDLAKSKQREGYDVMVQELNHAIMGRQYRRIYSGPAIYPNKFSEARWHRENDLGVSAADNYLEELDYE